MPVWRLEDDCLAPRRQLKIEFKGANPFDIVKKAKPLIQEIFEVQNKDYWERDFRWDITSDPRSFFVRIYTRKVIDARSTIFGEFIFQGKQPADPTKMGNVIITLEARLRTDYKLDTVFQQSAAYKGLIWFYHKIFYNKVRRNYLNICNDMIERLWRDFRSVLNMPSP